jgi:hypothetical protein
MATHSHTNQTAQDPNMKQLLIAVAVIAASTGFAAPAVAADVGVSITIGQPGFYGRIDIGDYPQPQLIYAEPIIVERYSGRAPIYMRVPPGHAKHWAKHCHEYHACGERVYFIQESWYNNEYVPRYEKRHHNSRDDDQGDQGNRRNGNGSGKSRGKGHKD